MTDNKEPNFEETYLKSWDGKYKGIYWEIKNRAKNDFSFVEDEYGMRSALEYVGHHTWTAYIKVYAPQLASSDNSIFNEKYSFTQRLFNDKSDRFGIDLNGMHGGCTFHRVDYEGMGTKYMPSFLTARKVLVATLGWDYQHSWDIDKTYTVEQVYEDVKETIESLLMEVGPIKVWSSKSCEFEYPVENKNV